jgi:hypothetical protein
MAQIALLKDLYYTYSGIRLYNKMLKESCYWPRHKIENYQFEKLKSLLLECYDGIPYYKQLFDSISFNPRIHFNELSDLSRLPILSKEFAKENKEVLKIPSILRRLDPLAFLLKFLFTQINGLWNREWCGGIGNGLGTNLGILSLWLEALFQKTKMYFGNTIV